MKTLAFIIFTFLLSITVSAQVPQSFRYQAVARDNSGNVLANQSVSFKISILSGSVSGTVTYSETHISLSTNSFGLVELEIGKGTPVTGTFSSIEWGSNSYFVKIEMDPAGGSAYQVLSTSQLLSVPYALHAKTVQTGDNWGNQTVQTDATLWGNGTSGTPLIVADNGITSVKIANGNILTDDLGYGSVNNSKILDGTITTADMANDIIISSKIVDGTIAVNDLGNNAITSDKIANSAVTGNKIAQAGATSGQALKWNGTTWAPGNDDFGSTQWLQNGSKIYYNSGYVGIGTSDPGVPLEVASAYIPNIRLNNTSIDANSVQKITFWKGLTEKFALGYDLWGTGDHLFTLFDTPNQLPVFNIKNGNVGIGTTTPAAKLEVTGLVKITGGTPGAGKVLTSDASGLASWQLPAVITDASFTGNGTAASPLKLSSFGASTGQVLKWTGTVWDNATDDNGPWADTSDGISYSGTKQVGIGINKPTQQLTVADGSTACYVNIQNTSTGYNALDGLLLGVEGTNAYLTTNEIGKLYLGTNSAIRLSIASDGDVGIGTTSPLYKLDVAGAVNLNKGIASGQAITCNGAEALWYDGTYFSWGYGGTWNFFKDAVGIDCQPGQGHLLAVNGVASKPGGGSWAAFSDIRLKDIHGQYSRGLEDIMQLQPVMFSYKVGNELNLPSKPEYVGFIAQDVQKVFPESVTETPGGYLEFDMHAVNVAVINAIKELKAENDRLKSENEQLNTRLEKIEALIYIKAEN